MPGAIVRAEPRRGARQNDLRALDAMAEMARRSGAPVHVILAREPGVVEYARQVAHRAAVGMQVDLMPRSIRVRYGGPAGSHES